MTAGTAALVLAAVVANTLASIFLKRFALVLDEISFAIFNTKGLILAAAALLFYAVAFVLYAMVLRVLPVSKAYTLITFGGQFLLIMAGAFLFGESFGTLAWLGVTLIFLGVMLVGWTVRL